MEALVEERLTAYIEDAERSVEAADGWGGAVRFFDRTLSRLIADRALSQVLEHGVTSEQAQRARDHLEPLAKTLLERTQASGRLRPDVTMTDLALVQRMLSEVDAAVAGGRRSRILGAPGAAGRHRARPVPAWT